MEIGDRTRIYSIQSPLISRTAQYRALLRLDALEHILEAERPDLLECGDPYQIGWKAVDTGAALGIPVIGFYLSHFPEAYLRPIGKFLGRTATDFLLDLARRYVRTLYNRFAKTLVPSPALGELLRSWGVTNVVPTDLGIDTAIFHPGQGDRRSIRAEFGLPPDRTLLLYVGRLAPEKNTSTLLAAFRQLALESPEEFHLFVVGDGHDRSPLHALGGALRGTLDAPPVSDAREAQVRHLAPGLSWLPYCGDSHRLSRLYRTADLFVHPGVQETFGLVTLEAQACGTPVGGIRGSYMDRIIHRGHESWATENSVLALAAAIRAAAAPALRQDRVALGREIATQYAWPKVFARLFDLYRQVVESYGSPKYE